MKSPLLYLVIFLLSCNRSERYWEEVVYNVENNIKREVSDNHQPPFTKELSCIMTQQETKIEDVWLQLFKSALVDYKEYNYESAIGKTDSIMRYAPNKSDADEILHLEAGFIHIKCNVINSTNLEKIHLSLNQKINLLKSNKAIHKKYYYIKYLHLYAMYLERANKINHAFSVLYSSLYLLEIENLNRKFPKLKSEIEYFIGYIHTKESITNHQTATKYLLNSLSIDTIFTDVNMSAKSKSLLGFINKDYGMMLKGIEKNVDFFDYCFGCTNICYTPDIIDTSFINLAYDAIGKIKNKSTNIHFTLFQGFMVEYYLMEGNLEAAKKIHLQNNYNTNNLQSLYKKTGLDLNIAMYERKPADTIDNILNLQRNIGKQISIGEDEYHLSDFFVQNFASTLDLSLNKFLSDKDSTLINKIIYLYSETSSRSLNNTIHKSIITEENTSNRIEEILSQLNDFKEETTSKDLYKELYELYEKQDWSKKYKNPIKVNWALLKDHLTRNKSCLIMTMASEDSYYFLNITNSGMVVQKLDTLFINTKVSHITSMLKNNKLNEDSTFLLSQHLFNNFCIDEENIILFPDAELNNLPFEILYYFQNNKTLNNIVYHYSLDKYLNNNTIKIETKDVFTISYSDESTLKNKEIKRQSELKHGYEEVCYINDLYGLNKSQTLAGESMNYDNVMSALKYKYVHLSTHASSNAFKRRDNYFICRDGNLPVKITNSEILSLKFVPQFVYIGTCLSGQGSFKAGEGNFSLSKAFIERGTQSEISTLWNIKDKNALKFTRLFYKYMKVKHSAGESLRLAKMEYLKDKNDPYSCFSYILTGNPNVYIN